MSKLIPLALVTLLAGCSTPKALLAPYTEVPESCDAIDAELLSVSGWDANVYTARQLKEMAATGLGLAASFQVVDPLFALAPTLAGQLRLNTHDERIRYLALVREVRGCAPLVIAEVANDSR